MLNDPLDVNHVRQVNPDDLVREFHDRVALGGVRHRYPHEPSSSAEKRIADAGRAAARCYIARAGETSSVSAGELLLALTITPEALLEVGASNADDVYAFGATVLGRDTQVRFDVRPHLLPTAWAGVVDAVQRACGPEPSAQQLEAIRAAMRVAVLALAHGCRAPGALPTWSTVEGWAEITAWGKRGVRDWRRGLVRLITLAEAGLPTTGDSRAADQPTTAGYQSSFGIPRSALPAHAPGARTRTFAVSLDHAGAGALVRAAHTAGPDADADALGLTGAARSRFALLRLVAPHFVPLLTTPRAGGPRRAKAALLRTATAEQLLGTLDRLLAQAVDLGYLHRLHALTPACLLREQVDAMGLSIAPPTATSCEFTAASLGRPVPRPRVPLLYSLLDRQAAASARRSPSQRTVSGTSHAETSAGPSVVLDGSTRQGLRFTPTLVKDAMAFADALRRTARYTTAVGSAERQEWERWCERADEVAARIADASTATGTGPEVKDVARLLSLVTWPQLLCVGLPALRARLLCARAALDTRPAFGDHPRVDEQTYEVWLERYLVLAAFCADPLRLKNIRNLWVGYNLRISMGDDGAVVRVHSAFTGTGGQNPAAALKRVHESQRRSVNLRRRAAERERTHDWSLAIVDPVLLGDYLTRVRTERIRRGGDQSYSLVAELRGEHPSRPLFISGRSAPQGAGEVDVFGPLSAGAIRTRFAVALHWVCTAALGHELPPWHEFAAQRGDEWYALFGPHAVRALAVIYWLRVRERGRVGDALPEHERAAVAASRRAATAARWLDVRAAVYVSHLLNDHVATMRRHYVAWPAWIAARLREPLLQPDWTHPRAYDCWMDRLVCADVAIDWSVEAELPLPPGLTRGDLGVGRSARPQRPGRRPRL